MARARQAKAPLAYRVVRASGAPLLLLDDKMRVVAASVGYLRTFREDAAPEGRMLAEILDGAWTEPRVQQVLAHVRRGEPGATIDTEIVLREGPRKVRVGIEPTEPGSSGQCPLVVSIEDRTDAEAREATREAELREAAALLHEAQHRMANNLSMISSILGLKARSVASEETRSELEGARRRVLAMATIERHLQLTEPKEPTTVRPYLQALCRQLRESLIGDARPITISVHAGAGAQPRRTAVIIGLVVTELIINALKYAFPNGRGGHIEVEYRETATGWCAAVQDDGVGLTRNGHRRRGGLGGGILAALAAQLHGRIEVTSPPAGLRVELCCDRGESPPA